MNRKGASPPGSRPMPWMFLPLALGALACPSSRPAPAPEPGVAQFPTTGFWGELFLYPESGLQTFPEIERIEFGQAMGRVMVPEGKRLGLVIDPLIGAAGLEGWDGHALSLLDLIESGCTDKDLERLAGLTPLRALLLMNSSVTGSGFEHLAELDALETLVLRRAPVEDAGLVHLAALDSLTTLDLHGTQVTDAGIEALAKLTRLKDLDLSDTRVTPGGIERLKSALPGTRVIAPYAPPPG